MLEEAEQGVIGPMQILEDKDAGATSGDGFKEASPCGEVLLASGRSGLEADQRSQALTKPGCVRVAIGHHRFELGGSDLGAISLQDPSLGFDDLAQRPEGDAFSVGQAPPLAPSDEVGAVLDVGK